MKESQDLNKWMAVNVFQAKDIQKIVDIPKHRYEYISSKIGIKPEYLEVEGTGRSHLYSFKNVLEFAFVHHANKLGLTPKAVNEMMRFISNNILLKSTGIFNPGNKTDVSIHYSEENNRKIFRISGATFDCKVYDGLTDLETLKNIPGYITINLGLIKDRILKQLE
jgi:hypothetical protein